MAQLNVQPGLSSLPNEILGEIFSYLDYSDLIQISFVNKRLNGISNQNAFWKKLCKKYWPENKSPSNVTWKSHFGNYYKDLGSYIEHYAEIKLAWDKMENYLREHCMAVYKTFKTGATEEMLDELEKMIGYPLPKDFRCSYRIRNGQKSTYAGLMGNCYHYQTSQRVLDLEKILELVEKQLVSSDGLKGCIPVTFYSWFSSKGSIGQYLAISDCDGYEVNTVFHPAYKISKYQDDSFITGSSFKIWLTSYADHLSQGHYSFFNGKISRYLNYPICEKTTGFVKISIQTCFQIEISRVSPPHFEYDYRVLLSMDEDSPESLMLQSSIWVTDYGKTKEVFHVRTHREPRLLAPGGTLPFVSTTSLDVTHGTISGTFFLESMSTGEIKIMECPVANLNSLPFVTAKERAAKVKQIIKP